MLLPEALMETLITHTPSKDLPPTGEPPAGLRACSGAASTWPSAASTISPGRQKAQNFLCTCSLPSPAQEGQSGAARRGPDVLLTKALHTGPNADPGTSDIPSKPNFSVYRFPMTDRLDLPCTFDMGEGWLKTLRTAQRHFFVLLVILLVW